MRIVKDILYKVSLVSVSGNMDKEVDAIHFDSRQANAGSMFVAISGTQVDGHKFIPSVLEKGVKVFVVEQLPDHLDEGVTWIQVANTSQALGIMASNFYDNPSSKLKLVGVTGTNGKTTTVTMLHHLFTRLGYTVGLLSTVENKIKEKVIPSTHTTPDAVTINALLHKMVSGGCTYCFMEVSSHAAVQHRITGLQFTGAVFTNITHDHLDYHKTFDEYIRAKKIFFDQLGSGAFALVNADDRRAQVMLQNTKASKYSFSLKGTADFNAKLKSDTFQGLEMEIDHQDVWFRLIGNFNAYNLLGIYATAVLLGEEKEEVLTVLSTLEAARGRFDQIRSAKDITVVVDYAHTPDALKNVLETLQRIRTGKERIITVVGCGGNRDAAKRPLMARLASEMSDQVIFTSDNPREEDPAEILKQMNEGVSVVSMKKTLTVTDRREAIKTACLLAQPQDIILIAGKGHETYQEIKGVKYPFDDKQVTIELLKELQK